jgi:pimeloyl-ACP methyl ester carboxylesterase
MPKKLLAVVILGLAMAPAVLAQDPVDYSAAESWLCRPGRADACSIDLTTTVISADGTLTRESWAADPAAPIDCFYVYPTVSTDQTPFSDMTADPAELNVIAQQFARFGSECRVYAPMYRQVTLVGLRSSMGGSSLGSGLNYDDVRDAWNHYLEHDNEGRGVVLIGHSQGSYILTELIRQEIDGEPVQDRLVSAILLGATVPVARQGGDGGAFRHVPLCRSAAQLGCLISYVSFRSNVPPPENTRFGRVEDPTSIAACTNPSALGGGDGELHAYLSTTGRTITGTRDPGPWVTPEREIDTPWVSVPGLLTARCTSNEHATYLEVTVHGNPADPRTDDIIGDIGAPPRVATDWGLHLVDANLAMGNLVDIVRQQSDAWTASRR